ncbi:cobyric acid synthase [Chloroflexus sp.]|uniref:cobyric acid synthase n=1 Tax=Chloroflexus sp. TaxID=1904827 RepID=UPI002ACD4B83|nr:cobyric acid synthase [Chloroflexus sp.]
MPAPVLMIVGTASSAGKSTLVAALCRLAARRGLRVAPFKAQNMSNNAAVTADGGEIARSTAVQAAAAGIAPTVAMNPILIKPEGQRRSQIIVEGKPWRTLDAADFWQRKALLWPVVTRNLDALRAEYDLVIAEGAGSPVELNLKAGDLVNMRVAVYARARTLLVGDIDRGGIFAQLLGTLMLLEPEERQLIEGLIINRFRGDPALFADGVRILEERGGVPVLGVVPWIEDLGLPEEDAVALEQARPVVTQGLTIAVIQLPAIANFDDFDPLAREPGVTVRYIDHPAQLAGAAAVILPGTKHTLAARRWLRERGFDAALRQFAGPIAGICGGYQLLGERISDPLAVEGAGGEEVGLGLLPIETIFAAEKQTTQTVARAQVEWGGTADLYGYEIHMGRSHRLGAAQPLLTIVQRGAATTTEADGCISADGRVWGCYIHGLFANAEFRRGWLRQLGWQPPSEHTPSVDPFDRLADRVAAALGPATLEQLFTVSP